MVTGTPYIPVNMATMKALDPLRWGLGPKARPWTPVRVKAPVGGP
jgi:hypothetical protein